MEAGERRADVIAATARVALSLNTRETIETWGGNGIGLFSGC